MDGAIISNLITNVGFPIALAVVLLFWMRQIQKEAVEREIRLGARIDELENRDFTTLLKQCAESNEAIKENYRSLRRLTSATDDFLMALKARPCLADDSFYPSQVVYAEHGLPRTKLPTGDTTKEETRENKP